MGSDINFVLWDLFLLLISHNYIKWIGLQHETLYIYSQAISIVVLFFLQKNSVNSVIQGKNCHWLFMINMCQDIVPLCAIMARYQVIELGKYKKVFKGGSYIYLLSEKPCGLITKNHSDKGTTSVKKIKYSWCTCTKCKKNNIIAQMRTKMICFVLERKK